MTGSRSDTKRAQRMKETFFESKEGEVMQYGLVRFLEQSVEEYAGDDKTCDSASVELTKAMLFVVVRLFTNLYSKPTLH
jgi:hypothetical protein